MFVDAFFGLSTLSVVLFAVGVILLIIEMFQPGLGLFGFSGVAVLIVNIIISARSFAHGVALAVFIVGVLLLLTAVFFVLMSFGVVPKQLILSNKEDVVSGYVGVPDYCGLVGQSGVAHTMLRPVGTARIGDKSYSVVTEGDFIKKGSVVKVKAAEGMRIVVELIEDEV